MVAQRSGDSVRRREIVDPFPARQQSPRSTDSKEQMRSMDIMERWLTETPKEEPWTPVGCTVGGSFQREFEPKPILRTAFENHGNARTNGRLARNGSSITSISEAFLRSNRAVSTIIKSPKIDRVPRITPSPNAPSMIEPTQTVVSDDSLLLTGGVATAQGKAGSLQAKSAPFLHVMGYVISNSTGFLEAIAIHQAHPGVHLPSILPVNSSERPLFQLDSVPGLIVVLCGPRFGKRFSSICPSSYLFQQCPQGSSSSSSSSTRTGSNFISSSPGGFRGSRSGLLSPGSGSCSKEANDDPSEETPPPPPPAPSATGASETPLFACPRQKHSADDCFYSVQGFRNMSEVTTHLKRTDHTIVYLCRQCNVYFLNASTFARHSQPPDALEPERHVAKSKPKCGSSYTCCFIRMTQ
ncbi:hypothetical protein BU16DRAFT_97163 [Lophium mytilinum]|uniref:Uncharacterized protein n=1 Tax=Lophium mytilinum TaxID=390894 RepID=A0A6A6QL75_9PEZI|nr:hypothetical protein BU16DRAFT_97163 [Lophium mytilinum]